jgi:hypothetical protein
MTNLNQLKSPAATRAPRRINGKVPPGHKSLQNIVPDQLYYNIHAQASLNCMDPSDYVYQFLWKAFSSPTPSQQLETQVLTAQETLS